MLDDQFNDFAYKEFEGRMFAFRDAKTGWNAGVQAERERITQIIESIDSFGNSARWMQDTILEKIDE